MYCMARGEINHLQVCKYQEGRGIVLRGTNISVIEKK